MNRILKGAPELLLEMMTAGYPIDDPEAFKRYIAGISLRVKPLLKQGCSRLYKFGPMDYGFVIPLCLQTDRPSLRIKALDIELPFSENDVDWDYEAKQIIPENDQKDYKNLLNSRMRSVVNHRSECGNIVRGVLCGRLVYAIDRSSDDDDSIDATLIFTDDLGITVSHSVDLALYAHESRHPAAVHYRSFLGNLQPVIDRPSVQNSISIPAPGPSANRDLELGSEG